MTTQKEKPLIEALRDRFEAAETRTTELLEKIGANETELASVVRAMAATVDADDLERLTVRRSALRTVINRARSESEDAKRRAQDTKATLSNLENEARKLRSQLGETAAQTPRPENDGDSLKASEARAAKQLADLTGKAQGKIAAFITSYLQLADGPSRKSAVMQFFGDWISGPESGRAFLAVHTILAGVINDYAAARKRISDHDQKVRTGLARLIQLAGPVDLEALRREHRERVLVAALDPEVEEQTQRGFEEALNGADMAIATATQKRDKIQREMQDHATTRTAQEQELVRLQKQAR